MVASILVGYRPPLPFTPLFCTWINYPGAGFPGKGASFRASAQHPPTWPFHCPKHSPAAALTFLQPFGGQQAALSAIRRYLAAYHAGAGTGDAMSEPEEEAELEAEAEARPSMHDAELDSAARMLGDLLVAQALQDGKAQALLRQVLEQLQTGVPYPEMLAQPVQNVGGVGWGVGGGGGNT